MRAIYNVSTIQLMTLVGRSDKVGTSEEFG